MRLRIALATSSKGKQENEGGKATKMKRILSIGSQIFSIVAGLCWGAIFFVVPHLNGVETLNILFLTNVVLIVAILIVGCTYFDMSIDRFYSWYSGDILPIKEKIIIGVELLITGICMMGFISMILQHNLSGVDLIAWEDMRLKSLGLIIANSWLWYVSYQAYHVVTK